MKGKRTTTPRCCKCNQYILVPTNLALKCLIRKHLYRTRRLLLAPSLDPSLLIDELGQTLQIPSPIVVLGITALLAVEPLQRREALHPEPLAQRLVLISVYFGDRDLVPGVSEIGSKLLEDRSKVLAVATPWRKEFNKSGLGGGEDDLIKV